MIDGKNRRLKFIFAIIIIFFFSFIYSSFFYEVQADEDNNTNDSILESQSESLGISSFIEEANKYKNEDLDIDINELITSAIKGNIDNKTLGEKILAILFGEVQESIKAMGSVLIIVVIASVLKSISDNLENKGISQITYYVTYILIVTIIMKNFSDIITMVRTSIESLVSFMNCLLPLLITLMATTRKYRISWNATTNNFICNYIYRKFY